jgi:hypothetical protein
MGREGGGGGGGGGLQRLGKVVAQMVVGGAVENGGWGLRVLFFKERMELVGPDAQPTGLPYRTGCSGRVLDHASVRLHHRLLLTLSQRNWSGISLFFAPATRRPRPTWATPTHVDTMCAVWGPVGWQMVNPPLSPRSAGVFCPPTPPSWQLGLLLSLPWTVQHAGSRRVQLSGLTWR